VNYSDLKPGDVMFYGRYYWLVIGVKITSVNHVVVHFVRHSSSLITANGFAVNEALPKWCEVLRDALHRFSPRRHHNP
jgi:hypothetical protein